MITLRPKFLFVLAIGVILASCSKKEETRKPSVVNVKTMRVSPSTHVIGKSYMGTIEEEDGANVSFDVTGNVKKVFVEEGQFVKKGQMMAEVSGENIRSAYEISAASLHQAEDAYRRLKDLYDKGTLPEIRMVEAETALRICREHYRGGLSTMTVLLDAQRQQQQALTQRHSAISEYLQAKTRYLIVTGRSTY